MTRDKMTLIAERDMKELRFHHSTTISSYKIFKSSRLNSSFFPKVIGSNMAEGQASGVLLTYLHPIRSLGAVVDEKKNFTLNVDRQVSVSRIVPTLYDVLQLTKGTRRRRGGGWEDEKLSNTIQPQRYGEHHVTWRLTSKVFHVVVVASISAQYV